MMVHPQSEFPVRAEAAPTVRAWRELSSRPERVFDAFFNPEIIRGSFERRRSEIRQLRLEPHVGGSVAIAVRRGGEELEGRGTIRELDRPRRLAFTWEVPRAAFPDSLITIDLERRHDGGTEVTVTHVLDQSWGDRVGPVEAAWIALLDAFAEALGYPSCDDPSIDEP